MRQCFSSQGHKQDNLVSVTFVLSWTILHVEWEASGLFMPYDLFMCVRSVLTEQDYSPRSHPVTFALSLHKVLIFPFIQEKKIRTRWEGGVLMVSLWCCVELLFRMLQKATLPLLFERRLFGLAPANTKYISHWTFVNTLCNVRNKGEANQHFWNQLSLFSKGMITPMAFEILNFKNR